MQHATSPSTCQPRGSSPAVPPVSTMPPYRSLRMSTSHLRRGRRRAGRLVVSKWLVVLQGGAVPVHAAHASPAPPPCNQQQSPARATTQPPTSPPSQPPTQPPLPAVSLADAVVGEVGDALQALGGCLPRLECLHSGRVARQQACRGQSRAGEQRWPGSARAACDGVQGQRSPQPPHVRVRAPWGGGTRAPSPPPPPPPTHHPPSHTLAQPRKGHTATHQG